jgi:hypothetical protein
VKISAGISLLGLVAVSAGCSKSPSAPAPVAPVAAFSVAAVLPTGGLNGESVRVIGTGFLAGAGLTLDGVAATVTSVASTVITATTPAHGAGRVDVVVTNPGGQSRTLSGGYTYDVVTLTASSNRVTAGSQLSVTWEAPAGRSKSDWVGLLKVGRLSTTYAEGWWDYTNGARAGSFTFSAPVQPGEYEFRYLLDDGFVDVARTGPVTVVGN